MQARDKAVAPEAATTIGQPPPVLGDRYVTSPSFVGATIHRAPPGLLPHPAIVHLLNPAVKVVLGQHH